MIDQRSGFHRIFYSDRDLLPEVWDALWKHADVRSVDSESFAISVRDGRVSLTGHLSKASNRKLIENVVMRVPGVVAVNNNLVVDDELALQVALALGRDGRTRSLVLPVSCSHGWVRLGGIVPDRALQAIAEQVTGQVPSVRGIVSLPAVDGEGRPPERLALQPRIGSKIYDHNTRQGVVAQIVIRPRGRLVTHAVVDTSDFADGQFISNRYSVPVEAMQVVTKQSVILKRSGPPLNAFPVFDPRDYPLVPPDWQPPYPYTAGTVRWLCEETDEPIRHHPAVL
jgi:osmotically-inducible protein OsmY